MRTDTTTSSPFDWSDEQYARYGRAPQVASHRLHERDIYAEPGIEEIFDTVPRRDLQIYTFGTEDNLAVWSPVHAPDATGAEILQAVRTGKLWVNVIMIERVHEPSRDLLDELYGRLADRVDSLDGYIEPHATLIVSSPNAVVQYHFDAEDNMLWHLQGNKTMYMYPLEMRYDVPIELQESIFARRADEELPYDIAFDERATAYHLEPGDVVSWPHTSPHRVTNDDNFNVSLSTMVHTMSSAKLQATHVANRYLRNHTPMRRFSTDTDGWRPAAKRFTTRLASRAIDRGNAEKPPRMTRLQLDLNEPDGLRELPTPIRAHFN